MTLWLLLFSYAKSLTWYLCSLIPKSCRTCAGIGASSYSHLIKEIKNPGGPASVCDPVTQEAEVDRLLTLGVLRSVGDFRKLFQQMTQIKRLERWLRG